MQTESRQPVALLIDFENLIYGLSDRHGERFAEEVDPEVLFNLAEEYGQVVLANAYADWRFREVNQFQSDLYRLGIELIHVFGKQQGNRMKNAVDVKMAVDAIEILWKLPHIQTFVIVSGDRDFIHVLKTLRRYGKVIVGVSPAASVSDDFAALCDRFVRYGALASALSQSAVDPHIAAPETDQLRIVREALKTIVSERRSGIKGSQIKPLLRRKLSASFDESEYGFSRLLDLLLALPDTVRVILDPNGGDITVLPADGSNLAIPANGESSTRSDNLLSLRAGLKEYRFESSPEIRWPIMEALFASIRKQEPFKMANVFEDVLEENEHLSISLSVLSKYFAILWQSRVFQVDPNQQAIPLRERLLRLDPSVQGSRDLIFRYESSITYKLQAAAREMNVPLDASLLRSILGLEQQDDGEAYCERLIEHSNRQTSPPAM